MTKQKLAVLPESYFSSAGVWSLGGVSKPLPTVTEMGSEVKSYFRGRRPPQWNCDGIQELSSRCCSSIASESLGLAAPSHSPEHHSVLLPPQEPGRSACPVLTRSAGSWWRPAGTGTPPWGPCSASWSPACRASWCACATATPSRRAAAWRTQTKTNKQASKQAEATTLRQARARVISQVSGGIYAVRRWTGDQCDVPAFLLIPSVDVLFMEGLTRAEGFHSFYCFALCVFVYKLYKRLPFVLIATWS